MPRSMLQAERIGSVARALAVSEKQREPGAETIVDPESAVPFDAVPSRPQDILGLADVNLSRPDDVSEEDWRKARDLFFKYAGGALAKVEQRDLALAPDEYCAMEALIIGDGTRPSFVLRNGSVASDDPFIGTWGGNVATAAALGISDLAAAVGRIQPQHGNASNFIGTGSLIDRDAGLILTNYHVIKQAEQQFGVAMTQTDPRRLRVDGALEIDFVAESGSLKTNCYRIVEVSLPEGYGPVFSGLDVVTARIEPTDRSESLPTPVPLLSAAADYANGAMTSLALIGFPAAPSIRDGENVDWDFVIRTLFGNKFGIKRLAPGRLSHALGSHRDDQQTRRALGHDATTFGGASGALVSAWLDVKSPCFAIHFGGATESSNYALSFAVAGDALKDIGVSFGHA